MLANIILPESMRQSYQRFHITTAVSTNGPLLPGQNQNCVEGNTAKSAIEHFRNDIDTVYGMLGSQYLRA
jgi:hypothetical protein